MPENSDSSKQDRLRKSGTLNSRPERVSDPRFRNSEFFDPRDLLQVRYELLRRARRLPLAEAARRFGVSVSTCVRLRRLFRDGGLQALVPGRRGPRGPSKITDEVLEYVVRCRERHGPLGSRRLVPLIKERFGISVHPRSLDRALLRGKKPAPRRSQC